MSKAAAKGLAGRKASILVLLVALLVSSFAALNGDMGTTETRVFDSIYSMPDSFRWFALLVAQLGNLWVVIGIIGLLFVVKWNPKPSLLVLRNGVIAYVLVEAMKFLVDRPRPAILLSEITAREIAVFGNGFPSGHTALATAVSLTLLPYLPRALCWLPIAWIGLVAWSRIYLGVHAPLDVLGGFIIGLLVVLLADFIPWPSKKRL